MKFQRFLTLTLILLTLQSLVPIITQAQRAPGPASSSRATRATPSAASAVPEVDVSLVKDLNPGSSPPRHLLNVDGTLFFTADDGTSGEELWKSDGTEAGTQLVEDINPDGGSILHSPGLTNVGGTLFFSADDGTNGSELWKSDGTEAGTQLVKDVNSDGSASLFELTNVDGTLFFGADDGASGRELWKSDGTEAGTQRVKDINPDGNSVSALSSLTNVDGTLFFGADDGASGRELWKSDGTEAGTQRVKDINPDGDSRPRHLLNVDGTLFFSADDGESNTELWKSDGTEAGTQLVKDIASGSSFSSPEGLTALNGTLFFSAEDNFDGRELWKSDGTEGGTQLVKDINPGFNGSIAVTQAGRFETELVDFGGTLFFRADDGTNGSELWMSDGTEAGTEMVEDIHPSSDGSAPRQLTGAGGTLFFKAWDGTHGTELWKAESTAEPGNLIPCPNLQLAATSAEPMDRVKLSGLPSELVAPLAVEVTPTGADTSSAFAFAVRDSFVVPLHPSNAPGGGEVELRFRGQNERCAEAVRFTIEPLPEAEGAALDALDAMENFIAFKAGLNDVTRRQLRNGSASGLPRIVWPLAIAQRVIDDLRPDIKAASGTAALNGRPALAKAARQRQNIELLDRLIRKTGLETAALTVGDEMRKYRREVEERIGLVTNKACIPSLITSAEELAFCMRLHEKGKLGLDDPSFIAEIESSVGALSGYAVSLAAGLAPSGRLKTVAKLTQVLNALIDMLIKAPFKIGPATFTTFDYDVTTSTFTEDETTAGTWSDARVQARSEGWVLDSEILNLLLIFEPIGDKLKRYLKSFYPTNLKVYADILFETLKKGGTDSFVNATEGEGVIQLPTEETAPVDITDPQWSNASADGLQLIDHRNYLPDAFPPTEASLTVETSDEFPKSIAGRQPISIRPIDVQFSTITNLKTGSDVPRDPTPVGCPGSNPTRLQPGTEYEMEVTVRDAKNPRVSFIHGVGSISNTTFHRLSSTSGETTFTFEAPRKPAPYITYIDAISESRMGLRARNGAPPRADNIAMRIGGEAPSDSDCEPPSFSGGNTPGRNTPPLSGGMYGHPHFVNFGGTGFDFQAVGEFVLARSAQEDDDFEVQLRLEPISGMFVNLTIATAVAMDVAGDRVVIVSGEDRPLKVNGSARDVPRGDPAQLPGGGIVYRTARGLTIDWPDGTYRVEALIDPDAATPRLPNVHLFTNASADETEGLVGGFATRSGGAKIDSTSFEQLYRVWGNDWRISQEESLFGTPTFADRDFPQQQFTIDQLSEERREEARQVCLDTGVTDSILVRNCILDVGTTEDPELAHDVANLTISPPETFVEVESPFPRPASLQAASGDGAVELSWNAVEDAALARYRIYRETAPLTGTIADFAPVDSVGASAESFTDTTVASGQTYYYRVTAVASSGAESGFSGEARAFLYPQTVAANVRRSFGTADEQTDYRLVALPGAVEQPLADAVDGEAGVQWQAYYDDGSEDGYLRKFDGSPPFTFAAGNGFWLTHVEEWSFSKEIGTVELRGDSAAVIDVHEGWNIISNPMDKHLVWSLVQAETPETLQPIWRFDGSFARADTFRSAASGEAYYFYNDAGLNSLLIPYPEAPAYSGSASGAGKQAEDVLALSAWPEASDHLTSTVHLGVGGEAKQSLVAPPGRFEPVSLRIEAHASEETSKRTRLLMAERRTASGEGETFDLRLAAQADGSIHIEASGLSTVEGQEVVLLQPASGQTYDLRAGRSVTIEPQGSKTTLQLAIGTKAYVEEARQNTLPDEVTLTSYPNPMRRQGILRYTLPEAAEVRLEVYDALGRKVRTLIDEKQNAGRQNVTLQTGALSSGVYLLRLTAGDRVENGHLVLIR
jgi:ELWxxDGT repeat protein